MNVFRFKSDLFFTEQGDDQIDHWFLGGDCAAWFFMRLMPEEGFLYYCGPTMEDWGWTMAVKYLDIQVWFMIYREDDDWAFGIETRKGFFQKGFHEHQASALKKTMQVIERIARSDERFINISWSTREPFATETSSQKVASGQRR